MRLILLVFFIGLSSFSMKLEAQKQVIKDSLSTSVSLALQEKAVFGAYDFIFKKVIADSRCPKNIMCVRAGEADVLVAIYKKGNFIKNQKIRIDASGYVMESSNLVFITKDFKIYGFSLSPYPDGVDEISEKGYQLEIVFKPKLD